MEWFANIKCLEYLKIRFRILAKANHPDMGGDTRVMREILEQYHSLAKTLPPRPAAEAARSGDGGAPVPAFQTPAVFRQRTPRFSHRDLCAFARALYVYGGCQSVHAAYGFIRQSLDPGQSLPYMDYLFNRNIAKKACRSLRREVVRAHAPMSLWRMVKAAQDRLAA